MFDSMYYSYIIQNIAHDVLCYLPGGHMTTLVSIRMKEELLQEMKMSAQLLHLSQTEYIRKAIELMNNQTEKAAREKRLKKASLLTREESMKVNAEFSRIDDEPEA
jgi:hypothetical protein